MPTYYQSSWAMISILLDLLFELYSQKMQTNMSHLDEENVALGYQNISPPANLPPKIELSFSVLKSPNYTQQSKRTFMSRNFLLGVNVKAFIQRTYNQYLEH